MTSQEPYTSRYVKQNQTTTLATSRPVSSHHPATAASHQPTKNASHQPTKAATSYPTKAATSYPTKAASSRPTTTTTLPQVPTTTDVLPPLPQGHPQANDESEPMYEMTDSAMEGYMPLS